MAVIDIVHELPNSFDREAGNSRVVFRSAPGEDPDIQ